MKRSFEKTIMFLAKCLYYKPISFLNGLFDVSLESFKRDYEKRVDEILPGDDATPDQITSYYFNFVKLYYKHRDDRRNIFVFFLVTIPTLFTGMYFLKDSDGLQGEYFGVNIFAIFFTWVTIRMFTVYRRKIYKKSKQIRAFQRKYSYLPKDFILTRDINYKEDKELESKYVSTTNLYRTVVVLVLIALFRMLFVGP